MVPKEAMECASRGRVPEEAKVYIYSSTQGSRLSLKSQEEEERKKGDERISAPDHMKGE